MVTVRTAAPSDVDDLLALLPGDPTDLRRRQFADALAAGALGWCFVAPAPLRGLSGMAVLRPGHLLGLDEVALLHVVPAARRAGVGRALVAAALGAATTGQVVAAVPQPNLAARALLAGAGWAVSGRLDGLAEDGVLVLRTANRPAPQPNRLYHLALRRDWERALQEGVYRTSTLGLTLAQVGFVHLAFARQVAGVAARFYRDVEEPVVLLTLDRARLRGMVVVEPVPGADEVFPHLYAPLEPGAVLDVTPLPHDGGGRLVVPDLG